MRSRERISAETHVRFGRLAVAFRPKCDSVSAERGMRERVDDPVELCYALLFGRRACCAWQWWYSVVILLENVRA